MNHFMGVVSFVSVSMLAGALSGCSAAAASSSDESVGEAQQELSEDVCPAGVPATLAPAADQSIKMSLTGIGAQVYMCNATLTGGYAWTFVAPQANLLNDEGRMIGTHFIGPTWQGNDESSVAGAKDKAATVDASALPWLLLKVTGHGAEAGRFSDVTSIQRLATVGGLAPTTGCDAATVGSILQVPYSAQYVFYRSKTHGQVKQCNGT